MGTDIHILLELQDPQGHWWTIHDGDMVWSDPWVHRFGNPANRYGDPQGLSHMRERSYRLFATLSGLRRMSQNNTPNLLSRHGIGHRAGLLCTDAADSDSDSFSWPEDISAYAANCAEDGDLHSHGAITWHDLLIVEGRLQALLAPVDPTAPPPSQNGLSVLSDAEQEDAQDLLRWIGHLRHAFTILLGTGPEPTPLHRGVFFQPLDDGYSNPEVDLFAYEGAMGVSAHQALAALAYRRQCPGFDAIDPRQLRILVAYDN